MTAEFKSFATLLRPQPAISPLIAEPLPWSASDRLAPAHAAERFEQSLQVLLREIACEVLGRELLLAPVEIARIVERIRRRYPLQADGEAHVTPGGDCTLICGDGTIDATLGRRLAAAIDRAAG